MLRTLALIGPTAVGKTDVSIELARELDAEIVGCDSMQVYRRMPVLTQQPTREQLRTVPHHLIDCIEPSEEFSVGQYRQMAIEAIAAIHARGRTALLVGGTGLYLKTLTHGFCDVPAGDLRIRTELLMTAQEQGSPVLYERLHAVDPVAASKIHPHDARRLVRALEVYTLTGRPLSSFWTERRREPVAITVIGLTRERAALYERINGRVERMIRDEGVLEEARQVLNVPLSKTARQVHGLWHLEPYLRGRRSLDETVTLWQQQVRQYARRQLIWFRAYPEIRWVSVDHAPVLDAIVEQMA